ncbi:hypothetical protein CEXT_356341 [Caerostris extrusa]|uniref:Uncharacterized protein n=1 Tax=Caerostris extrusa TaxID=172846 RepID=A0AAV4RI61_CAEEX|nr:hypothetical protein CEXT_356341 [Caerostris extrusa]
MGRVYEQSGLFCTDSRCADIHSFSGHSLSVVFTWISRKYGAIWWEERPSRNLSVLRTILQTLRSLEKFRGAFQNASFRYASGTTKGAPSLLRLL